MNKRLIQETLWNLAKGQFVGLSLGVSHNLQRTTMHAGEFRRGVACPDDQTRYEIGSITKTFAGLLLAIAVKNGLLNFEDDIRNILRGYPNLAWQDRPVRLWHLTNHVSGLPNMLPDDPDIFTSTSIERLPFAFAELQAKGTRERVMQELSGVRLAFEPGTSFSYSNVATQVLGYILEDVFGCSFAEAIQRFIAVPLGMNRTSVGVAADESTQGYDDAFREMPCVPIEVQAAGAMRSCVIDMLAYLENQMDSSDVAAQVTQKRFWGDDGYGIGLNWQLHRNGCGQAVVRQNGSTQGYSSYCVMVPSQNLAMVVLTNSSFRTAHEQLEALVDQVSESI